MILEDIEQKTLKYLMGASNPLVRFDALYEHVRQDERFAELSQRDLSDFVAEHELFRVIRPPGETLDGPGDAGVVSDSVPTGRFVILETRVPTGTQLASMMLEQLESIDQALVTALGQARERGDEEAESKLRNTLQRTKDIRNRLASAESDAGPS